MFELETDQDLRRFVGNHASALRRSTRRHSEWAADEIEACVWDRMRGHRCGLAICPRCARDTRLRLLNWAESAPHSEAALVTSYLKSVAFGDLCGADLERLKRNFRQQLVRGGVGMKALGGIETAWEAATSSWLIHAHHIALDLQPEDRSRLKDVAKSLSRPRAIKVQPIKEGELDYTATYCLKLGLMVSSRSNAKSRRNFRIRMPSAPATELAEFLAGHGPDDFLFPIGFRRRGASIELA